MIPVGDFDWAAENPAISWLMNPSEPSMQYLASRDLLELRPSERVRAGKLAATDSEGLGSQDSG